MTNDSLPRVSDVIKNALKQSLTGLRVSLPGIIQSYDPSKSSAQVLPAIGDLLQNGQGQLLKPIDNVPVIFPQTSSAGVTFPLNRGDSVLLVFSDRSLDEWLERGVAVSPADMRSHTLSDCFAIPGLFSFSNAIGNDNSLAKLRHGNSEIALSKDGKMYLQAGATDVIGIISETLSTLIGATIDPDTNMFIVPVQNALTELKNTLDAINGLG